MVAHKTKALRMFVTSLKSDDRTHNMPLLSQNVNLQSLSKPTINQGQTKVKRFSESN